MIVGAMELTRTIAKVLKDTTTLSDGVTYDVARILVFVVCLALIFFEGYDLIILHNAFRPQDFGIGFGAFAGGAGAMLSLKRKTEPDVQPERSETARVSHLGESVSVTTAVGEGVKQ